MRFVFVWLITLYQKTLSFDHGPLARFVPQGVCRFRPTCSEYSKEAFIKYGVFKGMWLTVRRIARCHPWTSGGHDPLI